MSRRKEQRFVDEGRAVLRLIQKIGIGASVVLLVLGIMGFVAYKVATYESSVSSTTTNEGSGGSSSTVVEKVDLPLDGRRIAIQITGGDWDSQTPVCLSSKSHTTMRDLPIGMKVQLFQWGTSGEGMYEGTVAEGPSILWTVVSGQSIHNYACEKMRRDDGGPTVVIDHWAAPRPAT